MIYKISQPFLVLVFALSLIVALPHGAFGCSCMMPEAPAAELAKADSVFAGRVISIVDRSLGVSTNSMDPLQTTFQVSTVWKGQPKPSLTVSSSQSSASCGYGFEQGREYIVYAYGPPNELQTTICTRTALLADAQADVAELGEGQVIVQAAPEPTSLMLWLLGGLGVAAVLALIAFGSRLFLVRSKQE